MRFSLRGIVAPWVRGPHAWTEPVERTALEAKTQGVPVLTPRIGQPIEPAQDPTAPWWPDVPGESALDHPIQATGL